MGCKHLLVCDHTPRGVNALNIEVGTALDRCRLKPPSGWAETDPRMDISEMVYRWLNSGGGPECFGHCTIGSMDYCKKSNQSPSK